MTHEDRLNTLEEAAEDAVVTLVAASNARGIGFIVSALIGVATRLCELSGHDPTQAIVLEAPNGRTITIHARKDSDESLGS